MLSHPQLLAREMIQRLPQATLGEVVAPGVVVKLSETPGEVRCPGPEIGEHTSDVYRELLGLSDEELAGLRARQVI
jgi:crotonobetainyl-CoA:carnitine CoA-transferase CaiB-like acyl-CoA transferase